MAENGKPTGAPSHPSGKGEWELAQKYAERLGRPHTLFTSAIRYLRTLTAKGTTILQDSEPYPLGMLLKSTSMRAVLYYAAAALHKEELGKQSSIDGFALFRVFPPDELASVLATTYIYRRVKRLIEPRVWETLSQEMQIQMEAGFHIGSKIPAIGTHRGLLLGVIRYAAMGLFSINDNRGFKLLKRELNEKELLFSPESENSRWGCNHMEIASILLQSVGLGVQAANALVTTACPSKEDHEELQAWYAAKVWIQHLLEKERAPECYQQGSPFFLEGEVLANLQERVDSIYEMGSSFDWIDKTKEDLPKALDQKIETSIPEEAPVELSDEDKNTDII